MAPKFDHDHATEQVRELLCNPCNTALGGFKDSAEITSKVAAYLERHRLKGNC